MTDELKNGDRVRKVNHYPSTGVYVGRGPDPDRPDVVWINGGHAGYGYPAGAWERIPDEVTITIPREVRDWCAEKSTVYASENSGFIIEACRASKAAES